MTDAWWSLPPAGCITDYSVRSAANSTAQIKPGDKVTGRYYQASGPSALQAAAAAAAVSNSAAEAKNAHEAERLGRLSDLERRVAANPGNEELWLLFALQHIDFGAVESMQGEPRPSTRASCSRTCVLHELLAAVTVCASWQAEVQFDVVLLSKKCSAMSGGSAAHACYLVMHAFVHGQAALCEDVHYHMIYI